MALLLLSAQAEDYAAAPGNDLEIIIVCAVSKADGTPVLNLGASSFLLGTYTPGDSQAKITEVTINGFTIQGCYIIKVKPSIGTWRAGVKLFALRAKNGPDVGTVVVSFLLD